MNQQEVINALLDKHSEPRGARQTILINGPWGVGKSHAWGNFANRIKQAHKDVKTLTLSLFGHSNLDELRDKLKSDFLFTKTKFGESPISHIMNQAIGNSGLRSATAQASSKWLGISIDPLSFVPLQFGSDYIVCFDDIERKSPNIPMRDILGLIEEVRQSSRVVIIADESKLEDADKTEFHTFREKVIDRTYYLETQEHQSLLEIFSNIYKNFIYVDITIDMFKLYGKHNLRTLNKLADFLKDISHQVSPNADFTRLCCAVVFESVKKTDSLNCSDFSRASSLDENDIYYQYFISDRLRTIGVNICSYYTTNKIDANAINSVLYPPDATPDDEMLFVFQEAFYRDEGSIRKAISKFMVEVGKLHFDYFRNIERIIVLFFYAEYLNDLFNLGYKNSQMESDTLETIRKLIDITNPELLTSVSSLDLYFSQAPSVAKNMLDNVEDLISRKLSIHYRATFNQNFQQEQYQSCMAILQNHPTILPHILDDVFNKLASPHCSRSCISFIRKIRDLVKFQYSQDIKNKLSQLANSTDDVVIKNRIETILRET